MASSAAKVGLFVVLALVLMGGAYVFLHGTLLKGPTTELTAEFDNAQGITSGTEVRMSGVRIGDVEKVEVSPETRRALVKMKIQGEHPVGPYDRITIATGGLLPAPYIEIVPPRPPGQKTAGAVQGQEATTVEQLLPQAQQLIVSLNEVAQSVNKVVGDEALMRNLKTTTANMAAVSQRGERIAANLQVMSARGEGVVASLERTGRIAEGTMAEARAAVGENRARIARLLDQSSNTMEALQRTLVEARSLFADEQTRENLRGTLANVRETTATLREAAVSLRQTAADVQGLTGDPKVQEDLRATITGARATMEEATELLQRINRIVGTGRERAGGARERFRHTDVRVDAQQSSDLGRPTVSVNATVPEGHGRFVQLGIHDLGEDTRLNLQFGRPLRNGLSLRYGMHASRLGAGLDWGSPLRPRLSADLYGLDDTRLDVRAAVPLRPGLDATFGFDRLFKSTAPVVGLRWHK